MFNQSELEGEVDHSFFDSDGADSSGNARKNTEKGLKAEEEGPAAHERLHAKHTEKAKGEMSSRTDRTRQHLKPVESSPSNTEERKTRSRVSSVSSVSSTSDKAISGSGSDSDFLSKRPNRTFMALTAEAREVNSKDAYNQSPNASKEEAFSASSRRRNKPFPKRLVRDRHVRSPSPTSSETSADADSESCGSSSRRSSLESPNFPEPNKSSLCPGVRRRRVGSSGSRDSFTTHTEGSDDTVTDVSPLSSPDTSTLQSLELNHTEAEEGSHKEQQQQESVPSSGLSNMHQDDEYSLSLEGQLGSQLVSHCPGGRNRKNYSFSNDEVRRIDRENQRLLRELSRLSPAPRPGSGLGKKTHMASNSPLTRLSHSAVNRQREQERINRENLAFLKRLESVKVTPGLKRSEQLADYQRQVGYLGAPSYPPICWSTTRKERPSSRTPSGPRPLSSRTASTTTTGSSSTPVPRSKKPSAARPAWC